MKRMIILISVFIILFASYCKKEKPFMNDAIITGSDMRMCVCCGGLMINFDGEARPYAGDYKLIENSADLGITEKIPFLFM
jgi:hypothetical protein